MGKEVWRGTRMFFVFPPVPIRGLLEQKAAEREREGRRRIHAVFSISLCSGSVKEEERNTHNP
jgi:hypothetical protein